MKKLRNFLRRVLLNELFDNPVLPDDLEEIRPGFFKFSFGNINYGVEFRTFSGDGIGSAMMPDQNLLSTLKITENKFDFNFGVLRANNSINVEISTNQHNSIQILNNIAGITIEFIRRQQVNVLTFYSKDIRRVNIYKSMYNSILKNDFIYYTAKENMAGLNVFLIRKTIL